MKPIRIMHVVRSLETGGLENGVRKLLAGLDPGRFQQKVCTLVKAKEKLAGNSVCLGDSPNQKRILFAQLLRLFRNERPDIVHSRNWAAIEAITAARLAGVHGVVHSEHGRDTLTLGRQPFRRKLLRRMSYSWANRVFCVSQELKHYYCRELCWGADKLEVIPNGVDLERFRPDVQARTQFRAALHADAATFVIGTVGRLDPIKDQATLLRASSMLLQKKFDVRVVIVGEGPQRSALEKQARSFPALADCTVFAGEQRNVEEWLNAFDAFVLPSLFEGTSNTLLEAMAVGVAPIVTNVGGNAEVVGSTGGGLLVEAQDASELCDCLVRLAVNAAYRKRIGEAARQRVLTQYSLIRMLNQYEDLYSQLREARGKRIPAFSRA